MSGLRSILGQMIALLLLIVSGVALAACVEAGGGVGGTGKPLIVNEGGIGGTGIQANGGIGGTGAQANGGIGGTGIVGTITGFASVCINGLEVDYDDTTQVSSNGEVAGVGKLAVGQVIAIDAVGTSNSLRARKVDVLNAVEGPVTALRTDVGLVEVMGQKVRLNEATLYGGVNTIQEITLGMPLKVSGYRNAANEIVASRIDSAQEMQSNSIIGVIERGSDGQYLIAGTPIKTVDSSLVIGSEALMKGVWDGQQLHVTSAVFDPSLLPFAGHANRIVVEGLVIARPGEQQIVISGFNIDYSRETTLAGSKVEQLMLGNLVRVEGRLQSGHRLLADHIQVMRRPEMGRSVSLHGGNEMNKERDAQAAPMQNGAVFRRDGLLRPMPINRLNSPMPIMKR
jgi:hypothetical protein